MNNILRRGATYGFFIGLAIAILFVKYKEVVSLGEGVIETSYKPVFDYIIMVLRISIVSSILGLTFGWYLYKNSGSKEDDMEGGS